MDFIGREKEFECAHTAAADEEKDERGTDGDSKDAEQGSPEPAERITGGNFERFTGDDGDENLEDDHEKEGSLSEKTAVVDPLLEFFRLIEKGDEWFADVEKDENREGEVDQNAQGGEDFFTLLRTEREMRAVFQDGVLLSGKMDVLQCSAIFVCSCREGFDFVVGFHADPALGAEITESAEVEDAEAFHGTEVGRVHKSGGFGEFERAAFGEDHTDKLGTEIAVGQFHRNLQAAEKQSDDAVGIIFAALEHIEDLIFRTVVHFIGHVHLQKSAWDIALFSVEAAVEVFFRKTRRQGKGGVFSCKAIQNGQLTVKRDGDMGERFAGKETDQPRRNRRRAGQKYVDGLHWNVPMLCSEKYYELYYLY